MKITKKGNLEIKFNSTKIGLIAKQSNKVIINQYDTFIAVESHTCFSTLEVWTPVKLILITKFREITFCVEFVNKIYKYLRICVLSK